MLKKNSVKIRDCIRKAAFGMNFAIIGIENQEIIDYSIPLRSLSYDVGVYEKQATKRTLHEMLDLTDIPEELR